MDTFTASRLHAFVLWLSFFFVFSNSLSVETNGRTLLVDNSTSLHLPFGSGLTVETCPGFKTGTSVICERIQIHGLSRLQNLRKYFHSVKVKVSVLNSSDRPINVEVCFHRNFTLGLGMCPKGQWEKLVKGSWVKTMSPFDRKLLDIRMSGLSSNTIEVSLEQEFYLYRVVFLVLGVVMMMLATSLSKSLVFYYGSAMAVGVILMILMILFQGMRLLPTGRRNSLAIFLYSSIVGLGSFFLRFLPGLLRSVLVEIGINEDMYYPLAMFAAIFVVLAGAWLGFWVVRKLVLTEGGLIDVAVSHFVAWSVRIFSAVMILQSTLDPLLAIEALICGTIVSSILRRISRPRFLRRLYKNLARKARKSHRISEILDASPSEDPYNEYIQIESPESSKFLWPRSKRFTLNKCSPPIQGLSKTPPRQLTDSDTYFSTFHKTPDRVNLSKDEYEKLTRDCTKKALEELVSSPDFNKWAAANAERITLTPKSDAGSTAGKQRGWLSWF